MRRLLLCCALLVPLTACESDADKKKPSPIPANAMIVPLGGPGGAVSSTPLADDEGVRLDQVLAVVEGTPLTLRTLVRRLGIDPAEVDDEENQREIMQETMKWAKERVFVKAAQRVGLTLSEPRVDSYVEERLAQELVKAEEEVGEPITREEFLDSEGLTWEEYRAQSASELLRSLYLQKILRGVGGPTRPQIDLTVSPAEVRRIYADHRELFDIHAGVRLVQFKIDFDRFDKEGRDFLEKDDMATAEAKALAADLKQGMAPEAIAEKYKLGESGEAWTAAKEEQFISEFPDPAMNEWLFEDGRAAGDARVIPVPTGMIVFGVLEQQLPRKLPFEEAYGEIVKRIQLGRMLRVEHMTLIDLITKGHVVWPDELADALLAEAHDALHKISQEDVWKGARLK